jgi:hypothetical protein
MIGVAVCVTALLGQGEVANSDIPHVTMLAHVAEPGAMPEIQVEVQPIQKIVLVPTPQISPALVYAWMKTLDKKKANQSLADAIALVVNDDPLPKEAAAKLVSISYHESHFDLKAKSKPSDPAKAIGAYQISLEWIKKEDRERFLEDPVMQTKLALMLVRDSQMRCGDLDQYTSGSCDRGGEEAMAREKIAYKLLFNTFIDLSEPEAMHPKTLLGQP